MTSRLFFTSASIGIAVCYLLGRGAHPLSAEEAVLAEIFELPDQQKWPAAEDRPTEEMTLDVMALPLLPRRYSEEGLIVDRQSPFVLRLSANLELPAGNYELLLRAMNQARLLVDGQLAAETEYRIKHNDGHNEVPELTQVLPNLRMLAPGHGEQVVSFVGSGGSHRFVVEAIVGGKKKRLETGELCLAVRRLGPEKSQFVLMRGRSSSDWDDSKYQLTDNAWESFLRLESVRMRELNRRQRRLADQQQTYWAKRHQQAQEHIASLPPLPPPAVPVASENREAFASEVDQFVSATLGAEFELPEPVNDYEFLRRLALDTIGVIPTSDEIGAFFADPPEERRGAAISRLLDDDRWADHWVSYWQDVLAENPGILKPKLNNTGPFRWWIHESFLDNKPMDRFVTELIMMRGSRYGGGPAGFSLATQNDVPMAAKANVLGQAFLGIQMKCARCHDSPQSDLLQEQLFKLAAMLKREPLEAPASSSVPVDENSAHKFAVTISLQPGSTVAPVWPFAELADIHASPPEGLVRDENDTREKLAAIITSYENPRFAKVIVNRLWSRLLGQGIVDSVDDWEDATNHSPELLDFLARELVANRYDLKHVARLILSSRTYQARVSATANVRPLLPVRRRQSAEQLVDSLFTVSGKSLNSEVLNLDVDGQRPVDSFLNLGIPVRAWEFTSLSNERDRPALAMPRAQSIVDLLLTFGWRDSRQDPITLRETEPTLQQPGILANGVIVQRTACLSDDNRLTQLCRADDSLTELIDRLFLQVLSRPPSDSERATVTQLLEDGFESRITDVQPTIRSSRRHAVSWSNHLNEEATRIKLAEERKVQQGDPPTETLTAAWRERAEDVVWALINSPEFVFVP